MEDIQHQIIIPDNAAIQYSDLIEKLSSGAKFKVYRYTISVVFICIPRLSPAILIQDQEDEIRYRSKYNRLNFLFGWWSIPGFVQSIESIKLNNKGGIDVTKDIEINLNEDSFNQRKVSIKQVNTLFAKPSKSDLKYLEKSFKPYQVRAKFQAIYVGLFLNSGDYEPHYVIGIKGKDEFEKLEREAEKALRTQFRKYVPFEFLDMNAETSQEFSEKLKEQGTRIV